MELKDATVVVQGFGNAGPPLQPSTWEKMGCILVGASDTRGSILKPDGIDLEALKAWKKETSSVAKIRGQ